MHSQKCYWSAIWDDISYAWTLPFSKHYGYSDTEIQLHTPSMFNLITDLMTQDQARDNCLKLLILKLTSVLYIFVLRYFSQEKSNMFSVSFVHTLCGLQIHLKIQDNT